MSEKPLGRRVFLGYTPDRERVYVDVRVSRQFSGGRQTIEHEPTGSYDELSISGALYAGASGFRESQMITVGQCVEQARQVLGAGGQLARGAAREDVALILDAWARWHLNGLKAACAHVEPVGEDTSERLRVTTACPVSGYRYGSAWLIEILPDGLVEQLTQACLRLGRTADV